MGKGHEKDSLSSPALPRVCQILDLVWIHDLQNFIHVYRNSHGNKHSITTCKSSSYYNVFMMWMSVNDWIIIRYYLRTKNECSSVSALTIPLQIHRVHAVLNDAWLTWNPSECRRDILRYFRDRHRMNDNISVIWIHWDSYPNSNLKKSR